MTAAVSYDRAKIVELLLATGLDLSSCSLDDTFNLLCRHESERDYATAQKLIRHGLNVKKIDSYGNSLLHRVCQFQDGSLSDALFLLENGVDVSHRNNNKRMALSLAIGLNSLDMVRLLLDWGARASEVNDTGELGFRNPLRFMAGQPTRELAQLLLERGAQVDVRITFNQRALHDAFEGDLEAHQTVEALLKDGATINEVSGLHFFHLALWKEWTRSLVILLDAWKSQVSEEFRYSNPDVLFIAAAAAGDAAMLQELLQLPGGGGSGGGGGGLNPNCEVEGKTALFAAAEAGQDRALEVLIPHVSNFDHCGYRGMSALSVAIGNGRDNAVRLLLPHYALFDIVRSNMLFSAVENLSPDVISLLLDRMMSPPTQVDLLAAQQYAVRMNLPQTDAHRIFDMTWRIQGALERSIGRGNIEIVTLLFQHTNPSLPKGILSSLMHRAMLSGCPDIALFLINRGVEIESRVSEFPTPLMTAAANGHISIVEALIAKDVDVNSISWFGDTALALAVAKGHTGIVRRLLDAVASLSTCDGNTSVVSRREGLLCLAARSGSAELTELFLDLGFDIDEEDPAQHQTPLYVAAGNGHVDVVSLLLNRQADVQSSRSTSSETSALLVAAAKGHTRIVELLLDAGAQFETDDPINNRVPYPTLVVAAREGQYEVVELLLRRGASMESRRDFNGESALMGAALNGRTAVLKLLLEQGASLDETDDFGNTALLMDLQMDHVEAARLLVSAGCDVFKANHCQRTPLHYALGDDMIRVLYSR